MDVTTILLFLIAILCILFVKSWISKPSLPGPYGLPYLGNVIQFAMSDPVELLMKWKKIYGDICIFTLFGKHIVLVSSYEYQKEMLVTKSTECAGRPQTFRMKYCTSYSNEIVASTYSHGWALRKKAMINAIKMYGERIQVLEDLTLETLQYTCSEIESLKGQSFDIYPLIHETVTNILSTLMFGHHLDKDTTKNLARMDSEILDVLTPLGNGAELDLFPWLRFFPNKNFTKLKNVTEEFIEMVDNLIDTHKTDHDPDNPQSVFDALYIVKSSQKDEEGNALMTDIDFRHIMMNILVAGTSTTSSFLYCLLAILTEDQELQSRLHTELDNKVGARMVKRADRENLDLLEATMLEMFRYCVIGPVSIPHETVTDVMLGPYMIPKGTELWLNGFELFRNKESWEDPWSFKPDRFLDEEGKLLPIGHPIRSHMMPFSAGRRVCPGEVLAKNRLFFMIATLLQRFTFHKENEKQQLPTDPRRYELGLVARPEPYKLRFISRTI